MPVYKDERRRRIDRLTVGRLISELETLHKDCLFQDDGSEECERCGARHAVVIVSALSEVSTKWKRLCKECLRDRLWLSEVNDINTYTYP